MRDQLDRYYTPDALAQAIVRVVRMEVGSDRWRSICRVIEPSVGGGAFVRALRPGRCVAGRRRICGYDVDPEASGLADSDHGEVRDYLGSRDRADLVIGNPPYRDAEAHIRHALGQAPLVCLLLRASILGGQKRYRLWEERPPRAVWQVVGRPSFTAGGTDTAEYAVILWDAHHPDATRLDWLHDRKTIGTRRRPWTRSTDA